MSSRLRLLFVTPELNLGGTNSSLVGVIRLLLANTSFEIKVFPISYSGGFVFTDRSLLVPERRVLSAYFGSFKSMSGFTKIIALLVKPLRRAVIALGMGRIENIIITRSIQFLQSSFSPDYVIAFQEGLATKFVGQWSDKKRIAWIHCDYDRYLIDAKSEESLYARYDKIVCVSKHTATVFQKRYPSISRKITSIHNPFDYLRIRSLANTDISDSLFDNSHFTIISLGRICPVKRFSLIPTIAKELVRRGLSFKWFIIGPNASDQETEVIRRQIDNQRVSNYVHLLGARSNPYPYLAKSDVLVCLSESEACPMIFNEAKLLNLSIVSSDFGSASEFINGNTVFEQIVHIEAVSDALLGIYRQNTKPVGRREEYFEEYNTHIYSQLVNLFI